MAATAVQWELCGMNFHQNIANLWVSCYNGNNDRSARVLFVQHPREQSIANNHHGVNITTHAIKRDYLIWMTTVGQPTKRQRSCVLILKYTFICVYWWTRQRIHSTLIVVDRYLRLMGDKTIPDSVEPRLESFYPPFVAGIDLPHEGVVDSYNLGWTRSIS